MSGLGLLSAQIAFRNDYNVKSCKTHSLGNSNVLFTTNHVLVFLVVVTRLAPAGAFLLFDTHFTGPPEPSKSSSVFTVAFGVGLQTCGSGIAERIVQCRRVGSEIAVGDAECFGSSDRQFLFFPGLRVPWFNCHLRSTALEFQSCDCVRIVAN